MNKINVLLSLALIVIFVFPACEKETQQHAEPESKPHKIQSVTEGFTVDTLNEGSDVYQLFEQSEMYSYIEDDLENKSYHILLHTCLEEGTEVLELQVINPENYDERFFGVEVDGEVGFDHLNGMWTTKNYNYDNWDTKVTITHFPNDEPHAVIYNMDETDEAELVFAPPPSGGGDKPSFNDCVDQCMHDSLADIFIHGTFLQQLWFKAFMPWTLADIIRDCTFGCIGN